ncbi:gamma-glutamylcyclotransferase family protein [Pseudobythopirellula maris]|nr:gamma-glutamylcyclotransferase family protein [Pseudobythopirellula maris]
MPPTRLFTYGTLQVAEVWRDVVGREFPSSPAVAHDLATFRVHGAGYPGAVIEKGATTPGVVYSGLDAEALRRLDRFEGSQYQRLEIRVESNTGVSLMADAYLMAPGREGELTTEAWTLERFVASGALAAFQARFGGFCWMEDGND